MNLQVTTLNNGLRIATIAQPDAEGVELSISLNVGSRNETEAINGASHFIEHMLFKGTPTRSAKAISEEVEGKGGSLNAFTSQEITCYYTKLPYDHLDTALDVLSDLFYHATFDEKELNRERFVIAEEIKMYADQPDSVAADQLNQQLWSGHPLGRTVLGPEKTVLTLSRKALMDYRKANYTPNRTLFLFSGRVQHDVCVAKVKALTQRLRNPKELRLPEPFSRVIPVEPFSLIRKPIQQTQLAFGWRTPAYDPAISGAYSVLSNLLGGYMSSRLFQTIREKRGLCYSIYSDLTMGSDYGNMAIYAGCSPEKAFACAKGIFAEVRKLIDKPVKPAELSRSIEYLCGRFRLSLDAHPTLWVMRQILFNRTLDAHEIIERVRAVTTQDIQAAAHSLSPDNLVMTIVAPEAIQPNEEGWKTLRNY